MERMMKFLFQVFLAVLILFNPNWSCAMGEKIYFAGGCFWGAQEFFSRLPGVISVVSGYANSRKPNPSYEEVCAGGTGAAETVEVEYDPEKISLDTLIDRFFSIINPFTLNRQGNDVGTQYRSGIYYSQDDQKEIVGKALAREQGRYGIPIAVESGSLQNFYPAEEYHQDYLKKNPGGYCHINLDTPPRSRGIVPENRYKLPDDEELKKKLDAGEYAVARQGATEPPFSGKYWDNHAPGIYVDVVTGEPLFSSSDKFDSGTGWPSFTKAIDPDVVAGSVDTSHGMTRIEVKSRIGGSHLGHIFADGPARSGGQRFCINSASLRFVPYEEMDREGYGYLKHLVKEEN